MRLPNNELYQYFNEVGVTHLFHANTVSTSLTFIQENGMLSRGAVETKQLFQTLQGSDAIDKVVDVWNDVFFDSKDLHGHFPRQNLYGPVSFKFSIDVILNQEYEIWITKNNPQYWNTETPMIERYFQSVTELRETAQNYPVYRKMILFKNLMQPVPFDHLIQILIDNPGVRIYNDVVLLREYIKAFKEIQPFHLMNKFRIRVKGIDCQEKCYCTDNYLRLPVRTLAKLFLPNYHPRF